MSIKLNFRIHYAPKIQLDSKEKKISPNFQHGIATEIRFNQCKFPTISAHGFYQSVFDHY